MDSEQTGTAALPPNPLHELPAALKGRAKIVPSENPEVDGVRIERWSIEKSNFIIPEIFAIWRELPEDAKRKASLLLNRNDATGEDDQIREVQAIVDLAMTAAEHCWQRAQYLIKLSTAEADREKIPLMDADEVVDLIEAILEVNPNLIPKLKKRVPKLLARFAPLLGAGKKKSTP